MRTREIPIIEKIFSNEANRRLHHCYVLSNNGLFGENNLQIAITIAGKLIADASDLKKSDTMLNIFSRIERKIHPDCLWIESEDKTIKVDEVRGLAEKLSYPPFEGKKRVVIVPNAEKMKAATANAILKILEEPPGYVVFLLFTRDYNSLLPTILSRAIKINIPPMSDAELERELDLLYPETNTQQKQEAMLWASGSLDQARFYLENLEYQELIKASADILLSLWSSAPRIPRDIFQFLDKLTKPSDYSTVLMVWQLIIRDFTCYLVAPNSKLVFTRYKNQFHQIAGSKTDQSKLVITLTEKINYIDKALQDQEYNSNMKLLFLNVCAALQIYDNRSNVRKREQKVFA